MAFVEQRAKQRVLSCLLMECDLSNTSCIASSSTLEKRNDSNVQGLFAARVPNDPTLQLASSSAIPHWMSTKQVQNILSDTSLKSGLTGNVVPSNVHESLVSLPSPKLGFGPEGQTQYSSIGIESRDALVNSRHLFQQQLPARPPLSVCLTPSLSLKRHGQKEEPETSQDDALSFFLHKQEKQEKQPAKECLTDLPTLSLGHSSSHEVSSWVSKFPFQIALNSEHAECGQLTQHRDLGHRLLTKAKSECLIQGASKGVVNVPSQLMGPKVHIDHCKFLAQHSLSSMGEAIDVLPQKTSLATSPSNSSWPLPATISGLNAPSLKRDWNATLMQGVKHAQLLPDFFAQQKVTIVAKANNRSHFVKSEDTEMKVSFSQQSLASRVSEVAEFNFPSLRGAFCSDNIRNSSVDHTSIKQQEMDNGGEALKRTPSSEENLHDSLRQVDFLRVKCETLGADSTELCDKIASSEGRVLTEALSFSIGPAADQAARRPSGVVSGIDGMVGNSQAAELMLFRDVASTQVSTITSASVPSLPFRKHSPHLKGLEGGKVPANIYMPLDGDWGHFLAAPSIGQTSEIDGKLVLPFQQRFEQLQKFLKKCDGSDKEYCLQALWSLSGSAQSNHSAELESRAIRLSLEEGKELKRAKLLNVLEEFPEGTYMNPYALPLAPWFSASTAAAVVKEEEA